MNHVSFTTLIHGKWVSKIALHERNNHGFQSILQAFVIVQIESFKKKGKRKGKEQVREIDDTKDVPRRLMSRFLHMGVLLPLMALVLLWKSFLPGLLLGLWYLLLPISPPFTLFPMHVCPVNFMDGSALLFLFLGQILPHKGLTLGNGFKISKGSQTSFTSFSLFNTFANFPKLPSCLVLNFEISNFILLHPLHANPNGWPCPL